MPSLNAGSSERDMHARCADRAVWRLRWPANMTGRLIGAGLIACLASAATVEGQSRYEAIDRSDVSGIAGLRIINIRDNLLKTCYAVFLADSTDSVDAANRIELTELHRAVAARDQRLVDLLGAFDHDRSLFAGTIDPNPLKYEWQANTAQVDFALAALNNMFARLEQDLLRAPRTTMTVVPEACVPPERPPR
jgi:hypothetical protein